MTPANKLAVMVKAQPMKPDLLLIDELTLNLLENNPEPLGESDLDGETQTFCGIPYRVGKDIGIHLAYKLYS